MTRRARPRHLAAGLVASLVALAIAAAATVWAASDDAATSTRPGANEPRDGPPLTEPVGRFVALGDSYTAGPLIPWVAGEDPFCLRSSRNYPAVLAQWLDARRLVDRSCSGATTRDLSAPQTAFGDTSAPQLDAVTPTTDLVTLGIGGNDFDLFGRLIDGERPPGLLGVLTRTGDRVADALAEIRDRAPDAVVALVGYPRITPPAGTCAALPFDAAHYRFVDRAERALNRELRGAASEQDAVYVDTYGGSRGHDACAGTDAWVNGDQTKPLLALAYHPYEAGMTATAIAAHTALRDASPTPRARRAAAAALARPPALSLSRPEQRVVAALLGG